MSEEEDKSKGETSEEEEDEAENEQEDVETLTKMTKFLKKHEFDETISLRSVFFF